jgi:hypothetical protein
MSGNHARFVAATLGCDPVLPGKTSLPPVAGGRGRRQWSDQEPVLNDVPTDPDAELQMDY